MRRFTDDGELERLLERCRRGDHSAWSRLVDRFQVLVYSVARRYGLGQDDAADVFQTTFQNLVKSLDRIESGQALPRWLAVTASRESLRIRRIKGRTSDFDTIGLTLDEVVANEECDAEQTSVAMDQAYRLRQALGEITGRCRQLLELLYMDEAPYNEISEKMSMPVGAIGPTRGRCMEKLKAVLAKQGFFDE
ncbi:RNA polymerase sigma factor [Fimbriimonas ginsengisoli]|uniref:RNA polymerase sigma factor n=1 Tax=Fimbriimonas ginsengisoli Gsoil 348 TaxID=661478 RepID=A0A068NME3_FIMGI|nr:sigma-70 family RNA polymerase sigma factor [Fimbriimonas ginsengisoli]AIE84743.1 RNA polymerase sigma factor [Fimbriimonas ginsengisoli Gsoil 348]